MDILNKSHWDGDDDAENHDDNITRLQFQKDTKNVGRNGDDA